MAFPYRWTEELHNCNTSIDADFLDGPKSLWCHDIDLKASVLGDYQIQVIWGGEVTCNINKASEDESPLLEVESEWGESKLTL